MAGVPRVCLQVQKNAFLPSAWFLGARAGTLRTCRRLTWVPSLPCEARLERQAVLRIAALLQTIVVSVFVQGFWKKTYALVVNENF